MSLIPKSQDCNYVARPRCARGFQLNLKYNFNLRPVDVDWVLWKSATDLGAQVCLEDNDLFL